LARGVRLGRPVLAAIAILMIVSGARGVVNQTRDQTRTPWENARFVADVARRTQSSPVLAQSGGSAALLYYVGSQLRLVGPSFMSSGTYCDMREPFVLVFERAAAAQTADPACLRDRHAQHLQAPQQISSPVGHRDLYDIWVVPAA